LWGSCCALLLEISFLRLVEMLAIVFDRRQIPCIEGTQKVPERQNNVQPLTVCSNTTAVDFIQNVSSEQSERTAVGSHLPSSRSQLALFM
jgi:hypothetical protein